MHPDSEVAVLAPVSPVAVPADPILHTVLFPPANNRNFVVLAEDQLRFGVNSSSVGLPFIGRVDPTSNRPSRKDFCLHPFRAFHESVLSHLPHPVLLDLHAARARAFVANLFVRTGRRWRVLGLEILAALLRKSEFHSVLINMARVAAIAVSSVLAVDDHLRSEGEVGPSSISGDVDAICQCTGGRLNPTVSAVVRCPLVFGPREVVHS